jgi:hypothetical protein
VKTFVALHLLQQLLVGGSMPKSPAFGEPGRPPPTARADRKGLSLSGVQEGSEVELSKLIFHASLPFHDCLTFRMERGFIVHVSVWIQ